LAWNINWEKKAKKELNKLAVDLQKKILFYLRDRALNNPRAFGKQLSHDKSGLWRYRVSDYRIVCQIEDDKLAILVLSVGHRREVYK
jgi:mRNA interferase RelE/StbE